MKRTMLVALVVLLLPALAGAATITVVPPTAAGNEVNAYNTNTVGALATPWTLTETFASVGTLYLNFNPNIGTTGSPLGTTNPTNSGHTLGKWFQKSVTNNTAVAWTSFEMELQTVFGTPSTQGDGLSFADGSGITGSFTSNVFSTYTRIDVLRDYLNFSGGTVAPGQTVSFMFAVTDNAANPTFWLLETPNKVDNPVPEPASMLLLGSGLVGLAARLRRRK